MAQKVTGQTAGQAADGLERFRPTSGRFGGFLGLALCAFVAVVFVVSESPRVAVPGVVACAFVAVLDWMTMLRPTVSASTTELHLRNVAQTVSIPLASIDTVIVRRYLLVRSGGRKYICPAIGRSLRKTVRSELKWKPATFMSPTAALDRFGESQGSGLTTEVQAPHELAYPDFVEQRITHLAADDRARRGIEERSEEEYELGSQVVRHPAWLELVALAVLAAAFVVAVLAVG
jgi:hypothetical protein